MNEFLIGVDGGGKGWSEVVEGSEGKIMGFGNRG